MKNYFLPITLLAGIVTLYGCVSQITLNLKKSIVQGELNKVVYYTGFSDAQNYKKVLLFIRGTGRFDASHDFGMGAEATLYGFAVVYPEKTYVYDKKAYYIHDNRQQRMHDIKAIIDDLIKQGIKKILLLADSEGTMLAPEIAYHYSNYICGLVCISGSVFPFQDDLLFTASHKKVPYLSNIKNTDMLMNKFNEIYSDPNNVEKDFLGHPYKFWSSYLKYKPSSDLKKLSCPILYLNGEKDDLDIAKQQTEIQQLNKNGIDIEQIVYSGAGHELKSIDKTAKDILNWGTEKKIAIKTQK